MPSMSHTMHEQLSSTTWGAVIVADNSPLMPWALLNLPMDIISSMVIIVYHLWKAVILFK